MDIFEILTESRNPNISKYKYNVVSKPKIIVEADDDLKVEPGDSDVGDGPDVGDTDTSDKSTDKSSTDDTSKDSDNGDKTTDDDNDDELSVEPGDSDVDDGPDIDDDVDNAPSASDSSMPTETEAPKDDIDPERTKSLALLDDTIFLYYSIRRIIDKLNNVSGSTIESMKAFTNARDNFVNLSDLLYTFITERFNTNTYVKNLYIFNYFIQTYKLNTDILEKTINSDNNK